MSDFPGGIGDLPPTDPIGPPGPISGGIDLIPWIQGLAAAISQLAQFIAKFFTLIVNALRALGAFLLHLWQNYVKKAIAWLARETRRLLAWLKRTIKPIIDRLEKIKKWYDEHILKQQLRMLQLIQQIRRFLGILRLFHVKWATQLDNALGDVQNRIEQAISIVRGHLNGIINWLNALSNPIWIAGLLHKGGFFIRSLDALFRGIGIGGLSSLTPGATTSTGGLTPNNGIDAIRTAMQQDTSTQSGPFNETTECANATWKFQERFGN